MRRLHLPWRLLLPGMASPISAALNFPAFVYSGPASCCSGWVAGLESRDALD